MRLGLLLLIFRIALLLLPLPFFAQTAILQGRVSAGIDGLPGASVFLPALNLGVTTDRDGKFLLRGISPGMHEVKVRFTGYLPVSDTIHLAAGETVTRDFLLEEDALRLGDVVVTGGRYEILRHNSPIIINTIQNRIFETTQSVSIAEGLNFSPGLRLENNCQNCGFTQLRMNGLEGPYSQILVNSRPIFSALAGVYGLEMFPANMVDRIEVVRGGGSVLYGGNAIAGTVNIITRDPVQNSFEAGLNQSFINGNSPDQSISLNASVVSDQLNQGMTFFGFSRERSPWDANGDGFSEMVKLKNNTFGFDAFLNLSERKKLKAGAYFTREFRRGGNQFDRMPHQADLAEQLEHEILSSNFSYEHMSRDLRHKISAYSSFQRVDRASYYGSGGRVIGTGDSLTAADIRAINAYGNSNDFSLVGGLQYNFALNKKILLIGGSEYILNQVKDAMPGYGRSIEQQVATSGNYLQAELKPSANLTLLLGGRFDVLTIDGTYKLGASRTGNRRNFPVLVPRISAMYRIGDHLKLRASFAQGYRGPQAFNEDLHIETVGGAARFIRLDPALKAERSNSALISLNYESQKDGKQLSLVGEFFATGLLDPFITGDQIPVPGGAAIVTKRNGGGAMVAGMNLELNLSIGGSLIFQSGGTFQSARYRLEEEIWSAEEENSLLPPARTRRLLRTPDGYGYFSMVYNPVKKLSLSWSGVLTGPMLVPHVINAGNGQTVLKNTPGFLENNFRIAFKFRTKENLKLELFGGVQNMFNRFQRDFDRGMLRDAGYVYGPSRSRTLFIGMKAGMN